MINITYTSAVLAISAAWLFARAFVWLKNRRIKPLRELQLLLVYICIIVVTRFTFFPFERVDGMIQPLVFDAARIFPPRVNFIPFVYIADYELLSQIPLNIIGNIAMFIPIGIVWPAVFRKLDSHKKVIAAGFGFSLSIEIVQLLFSDRVTDIDDLLLNTLGYLIGYGIFLLCAKLRKVHENKRIRKQKR